MHRKERQLPPKNPKAPKVIIGNVSYSIEDAYMLAVEYIGQHRKAEAMAICRQVLEVSKSHIPSLNALGILVFDNNIDEAISLFKQSIRYNPNLSQTYNNLGYALISKGAMEEAEAVLLKAVSLDPRSTRALYNLSLIRKYPLDHQVIKHMQSLAASHSINGLPHAEHLYFALGKAYDDNGLYDEAFAHYAQANQIRNKAVDFNPAVAYQSIAAVAKVFTKEMLSTPDLCPSTDKGPVFIIGMPRSGTTLLANILSSHPAIHAAGELPTMIQKALTLPALLGIDVAYPEAVRHLTKEAAQEIIAAYRERLWQGVAPGVAYVIDKHPINFRYLGLIQLLFPNAKIFHCTRHPLDTCLSNYFQCFTHEYSYSFDLLNTGHFYNCYKQLMQHWQKVLSLEIMEVSYESMVGDTETIARKALEFLGLPWDERCLAPHQNARAVQTSSMWQVRQPVYRNSLARWQRYEKHLEGLKGVLGEV